MIVNHAGMPVDRDPDGLKLWRDGMKKLASADNVVAKISGLGMVEHNWTNDSIRPFVLGTIDAFGSERAMFGSNFPVDRLYGTFGALYRAFETIVADFTPLEQDRLFRVNAERWYRHLDQDRGPNGPLPPAHPRRAISRRRRDRASHRRS